MSAALTATAGSAAGLVTPHDFLQHWAGIAITILAAFVAGAAVHLVARRRERRRLAALVAGSERHLQTLGTVSRISREAAAQLDPDALIHYLVHTIHAEFGYNHVTIMTYDPVDRTMVFSDSAGEIDAEKFEGYRQSLDRGIIGRAVRTRAPVLCNDTSRDPDFVAVSNSLSELAIPLMNAGQPVGVLNIESVHRNAFDEPFAQLMEILAEQIVPAVLNARLFREIANAKTEWERTFDAISDPVALQDRDGTIRRANLAFAALCRLPIVAVPGRNASQLLFGGGVRPYNDPIAKALEGSQPATAELDLPHLGGLFILGAFPYRSSGGAVEGLVLIARDVTRQREMEMQALHSARLAAMGMLASGVAHDFNNLMAAILLRAQMLDRALTDAEQRRWVEVIARSATDGSATVRRMLDFARMQGESGRMRLDVNELLRQVVELTSGRWKDQAQARGAAIRVATDLSEVPAVLASPSEIREVFTNLVLNAADAMPSGGTITLRSRASDGRVRVEVADDGVGIPPEHLEKIFTPFFSTKGSRGTGLGLSVSAGILQRHEGSIRVESVPGRGTTFAVDLPAATGAAAGAAAERASEIALEVLRAATGRILLVDDEADVREAMADILRLESHEVDEAPDGKAAIELASSRSYDLIVSDLGMPGMSGIEVLRLMRDLQPDAATMLVTGWGQQLGSERASEEGIDKILSKPVPMADLLRSVAELLSGARPSRPA